MPKTTTHSGASNAWEPEIEAQVESTPEPDTRSYDEMSLADLQDASRERGLPVSGTKANLAQALAGYDDDPPVDDPAGAAPAEPAKAAVPASDKGWTKAK